MKTAKRWGALAVGCGLLVGHVFASGPSLQAPHWPGLNYNGLVAQPEAVVVGYPYTYTFAAPTTKNITATGVPPGLAFDATYAQLSGTPTQAGSFPISLTATDATGTTTLNVTLTVAPAPTEPPSIPPLDNRETTYVGINKPTLAPDEQLQTGFLVYTLLNASNYPTSYSATGLPAGAEVDQWGDLWYVPNNVAPGRYDVTVTATNAVGSGSATFHWDVHPGLVSLTPDKSAYAFGDTLTVAAKFTGPVVVTGQPYIPVRSGTRQAVYVSGSGTDTLVFQYKTDTADGTFTEYVADHIELNGGTLLSPDGLSASPVQPPPTVDYWAPSYTVSNSETAPPVIRPIADMQAAASAVEDYQFFGVQATNAPTSWSVTGLPPGVMFVDTPPRVGFQWSSSFLTGGEYTVTLSATNAAGTSSVSFPWKVHPALVGFIMSDKASYSTGQTVTLTGKFSAPVVVVGTPYIPLRNTNNKRATYVSGSGTNTLTFQYTVEGDDPSGSDYGGWEIKDAGSVTTPGGTTALLTDPIMRGINPPTFAIVALPPQLGDATVNGQVGTAIAPVQLPTQYGPAQFTAPRLSDYGLAISSTGEITGTPTQSAANVVIAVTATNAGGTSNTATITLDLAGTNPPPPPPPPPSAAKSDQTITFASPVSAITVGVPIALGAQSSAGLPVTYSVVSGDATISGATLTPLSTATLVVRAASAGNDAYNAASVDVNFGSPRKGAQAISVATSGGPVPAEQPVTLAATASSGLPVAYTVVSGPGTLTGNILTFTGTGTVTVQATQAGNGAFDAAGAVTLTFTALPVNRLVNLSSRLLVRGGDAAHPAIAGFVIGGSAPKQVLIRAVGPSLTAFGVPAPLPDPQLRLYDAQGQVVASNSGWADDAQVSAAGASVGAFALSPGSKDAALLLTLAPGLYTAQVDASTSGTALIEVYDVAANATVPTKQLLNISTRAYVGTGDGVLVAGFVVSGSAPKRVLIRAVGPGLAPFGVSDSLADPQLVLRDASGTALAQNDDWGTPTTVNPSYVPAAAAGAANAAAAAGAFALPSDSKDAVLDVELPPGLYTAVVTGAAGSTGTALIEVYDVP